MLLCLVSESCDFGPCQRVGTKGVRESFVGLDDDSSFQPIKSRGFWSRTRQFLSDTLAVHARHVTFMKCESTLARQEVPCNRRQLQDLC